MQSEKSFRVDVADLKALMLKKIGPERLKQYLYCLDRFINRKLGKAEFNRSCLRVLGRENLGLHNHIIRSVLKNACTAKAPPQANQANAWIRANGVALPMCPRKARSGVCGRKSRDRPSPLGKTGSDGSGAVTVDNRHVERAENVLGKNRKNVPNVEEGEEVEQASHFDFSKSPLVAPLGIPLCGPHKASPIFSTVNFFSSVDTGVLPDSEMVRQRMEQIAAACGLAGGVTMECATSLNCMVDLYLKRMIKSCVDLVGEGSKRQELHSKRLISVHDFKVAMELKPQQLGEDWPLLMERISMQSFEE